MYRGGEAYYLYKDTVMSKVSTFRPEWIQQLKVVDNSNPNNNGVKFNNGHFLHQFTYFIGPVNFYYILNNKKRVLRINDYMDANFITTHPEVINFNLNKSD